MNDKRFCCIEQLNCIYDMKTDTMYFLGDIKNIYALLDLINKQIADLQHRLEVSEKALELACEELDDSGCIAICNYCPYNIQETCPNECPQNTTLLEKYFKEQAEKEVKRK